VHQLDYRYVVRTEKGKFETVILMYIPVQLTYALDIRPQGLHPMAVAMIDEFKRLHLIRRRVVCDVLTP
jgi:hypothetical protein